MASDYGLGGGASVSAAERVQLMEQMKGELAIANAQQLIQVYNLLLYLLLIKPFCLLENV